MKISKFYEGNKYGLRWRKPRETSYRLAAKGGTLLGGEAQTQELMEPSLGA